MLKASRIYLFMDFHRMVCAHLSLVPNELQELSPWELKGCSMVIQPQWTLSGVGCGLVGIKDKASKDWPLGQMWQPLWFFPATMATAGTTLALRLSRFSLVHSATECWGHYSRAFLAKKRMLHAHGTGTHMDYTVKGSSCSPANQAVVPTGRWTSVLEETWRSPSSLPVHSPL